MLFFHLNCKADDHFFFSFCVCVCDVSGWPLLDSTHAVSTWEGTDRQPDRVQPGAASKTSLISQQHGGFQAAETSSQAPLLRQLDQWYTTSCAAIWGSSKPGNYIGIKWQCVFALFHCVMYDVFLCLHATCKMNEFKCKSYKNSCVGDRVSEL